MTEKDIDAVCRAVLLYRHDFEHGINGLKPTLLRALKEQNLIQKEMNCENCRYSDLTELNYPCDKCHYMPYNKWKPKEGSNE